MKTADQVITLFLRSERIYQDFLLALGHEGRFHENFIVRPWVSFFLI